MKKYVAELIGTFSIIFFGHCSIAMSILQPTMISNLGIALINGLIVTLMIYSFARVSGAHFNPAITVSFCMNGDMHIRKASLYVIAQIFGGILGSYFANRLFSGFELNMITEPKTTLIQAFAAEFILTLILMLVVYHNSIKGKEILSFAPIQIGIIIFIGVYLFGAISCASFNPARSIGPAIVANHYANLWLYLLAPVAGAATAKYVNMWYRRMH